MSDPIGGSRTGGRSPAGLRALVVDDEPPLVKVVSTYLEREGFEVATAGDGEQAVVLARELDPDVIVLDLMLPGIDGIEACRQIRAFSDAYIVMLTARVEEIDRIVGLSTGADDYVTKPFSPGELMARVRAMLRRPRASRAETDAIRRFGDLEIDATAREVRRGRGLVELTKLEFDLLEVLSGEPRVAFSRERLLERVWGGSGSAMTTSSTFTSATSARSSAMTRARHGTCERSAASATAWEKDSEKAPVRQSERKTARRSAARRADGRAHAVARRVAGRAGDLPPAHS